MTASALGAILAALQIAVPAPRGYVNDFAGVLDSASVGRLEAVIAEVKEKTQGEIVVVTLADIGERAASDVALEIGRAWRVGPGAPVGDRARNLGVVVLLVPRKAHRPGTGQLFISTGRGAEGFLTDARAGQIRDAMLPEMAREDYGPALVRGVGLIAQAFATEFGVTLSGGEAQSEPNGAGQSPFPFGWLLVVVIFLIMFGRGRLLWLPFLLGGFGGGGRGWRGGGWGGGGGGGGGWGGGGFGGGFGGFGGGGGFSGGGAGGSF